MKRSELIAIEDWDEFISILYKTKYNSEERCKVIGERWEYLYQKYRPAQEHINARREWNRRNG